jgi:hypothetical protein
MEKCCSNTSATAEDNTTAANDKRLNIKVVMICVTVRSPERW